LTTVDIQEIRRAAELIRQGRLVAFPTETVYGLGANALDATAVGRIFQAKGRPSTSPLIVHVDSVKMARGLVRNWPDEAEILARRFWPGPLTLVLHKLALVPDVVTAGLSTVGIRMPAHAIALALIREAGVPIAAPSANRFSELSPVTAAHVRAALGDRVDCILDGGPAVVGIESTVLTLATSPPRLLRPGGVSRADIEALIGPVELVAHVESGESVPHQSPGMHRRHYSPVTPLILVAKGELLPEGRGVYLWRERPAGTEKAIEMPGDPAGYAAVLYNTLHREDVAGWDWIAVEEPPGTPEWAAVADRLWRAAASRPR
jgi:L-threonylcarbamoyladenylate synthase